MKRRITALILATFMVATLLIGCSQEESVSGKYLRLAKSSELASMDQHVASDGLSFEVISSTMEGLYSRDKDGNCIPAIAESYDVSDDGLTYTFHLKKVKWSNGDLVTAEDFEFSWKRLLDPETASEYSFIGEVAGIKNAAKVMSGEMDIDELRVKAIDGVTFEVELERPIPYFVSLTAFPTFFPLNEKFVAEKGEEYALEPENLLANGPYKMVEWNKGYGFKLEKNTEYYDASNVQIDGLEFRVMKDPQTAVLKFESGELDVVKLSSELVDRYKSNPGYIQIPEGYVYYIAPNHEMELFSNLNARKALYYGINKDHIANKILNDGSIAANFIVATGLATGPDGKDFCESSGGYGDYDKELALQYWNEAKNELGKNSFEIELLFDDFETIKKMSEFIQAELESNFPGLTVNLKAQPKKNRQALMKEGSFELGITRWGPDYADPLTYLELFIDGSSQNTSKYENEKYNQLVYESSRGFLASDPQGRWDAMMEAEKILLEEDAAVMPIFQQGYAFLINEKVSGIETHIVGAPNYSNVMIED